MQANVFSATQASRIIGPNAFDIVTQMPNDPVGFSAMLLRDNRSGPKAPMIHYSTKT